MARQKLTSKKKMTPAQKYERLDRRYSDFTAGAISIHNAWLGFNTFEIDISDYVYYDSENVLAVYIDRQQFEGWWYQGGGIYRDVHLIITEPVAIDLWGVYVPYKKTGQKSWYVQIQTTVVNASFAESYVTAASRLLDKNGKCVAQTEASGMISDRDKGTVFSDMVLEAPLLWDCDTPNLYTVHTVLYMDGQPVDENYTRIGFRTVEVSGEKGLLLNGKRTFIRGVCAHQDYGITGLAVPDNVARYKVLLMKQMGANGYRTSHYQQTEAYMDAFDEMGFLVMDEARWFESTKEAFEQLSSLVKRDRNRPSVIFWSTSNEEPLHIQDIGRRIHRSVASFIRKLDDTRIILAAQDKDPDQSTIYDDCDVIGINYNLPLYDRVHQCYPEKAVLASECAAAGTSRDWCFPSDTAYRLQELDQDGNDWFWGHERTWKFLMERPYVIGAYQWDAVEHRGEASWPRICSSSGSIDLFLQKKSGFYQNLSHWTQKPMAHIVPHWNFTGLEGKGILVPIYTNCQELELFCNGKSLGRKQIEPYGRGNWYVIYEPGEIKVYGYQNGEIVCSDSRITTGKPVKLTLTLDNTFEANGNDLALFTCQCEDAQGRIVPDAEETVTFSVNSPAQLVGTGSDNCDHTRVSLPVRKMYMGKISVAVRPAPGQTALSVLAHCKDLADCMFQMKIPEVKE